MPTDRIMETLRPYQERIASLESQLRAAEEREGKLRRVVDAAQKIRHWHDSHDGGMVVSGAKVRELWAALASAPTRGEGITDTERLDLLIRNRWTVGPSPHQQHGLKPFICYRNGGEGWPDCIAGTGETERLAIDDARLSPEPDGGAR